MVCPETSRQWSENIVSRFCAALKSLAIVRQDLVFKDREGDEYWVSSRRVAFAIAVDRLPSEAENLG